MSETGKSYAELAKFVGAVLVYLFLGGFVLFIPFAMGECLPRDTPATAICDAEKRTDVGVYLSAFFINLIAASVLTIRSLSLGTRYLLITSVVPFLIVLGMTLLRTVS